MSKRWCKKLGATKPPCTADLSQRTAHHRRRTGPLKAAGFTDVAHVVHGFEGDRDAHDHRSTVNGWRHDGLPWEQM